MTFADTSADCLTALEGATLSRREGIWPLRYADHQYPHLHRLLEADRLASASRGRLVPDDLSRFVTTLSATFLRALDDFRPYVVIPLLFDDMLHHAAHAGDRVIADRVDAGVAGRCMGHREDRRGSVLICLLFDGHSADHGWGSLRGHRARVLHAEGRLAGPYLHDREGGAKSCTSAGRIFTVLDHFEPGGHYFDDAGHHPDGTDVGERWGPW